MKLLLRDWHHMTSKAISLFPAIAILRPLAASPATPVNDFGIELSSINFHMEPSPGSRTITEAECAVVTPSATTPTME